MKKLPIILFTILYLLSGSAFPLTAHFCKGKLASVSISTSSIEPCVCGVKSTKKKCCENKQIQIKKVQSEQSSSSFIPDFKLFQNPAFENQQPVFALASEFSINKFLSNHHPLDDHPQDICILNQVFRI